MKACVLGLVFTPDTKKVLLLTMPGGDIAAIAPIMASVARRGAGTDKMLRRRVRELTGLDISDWQPVGGYNLSYGFFEVYRALGNFKARQVKKDFIPVWLDVTTLRTTTGFNAENWNILQDALRLGPERKQVISTPGKQDFILRLELMGIRPAIWRRVRVPADIGLPALHEVIQAAFGWSNTRAHRFVVGKDSYQPGDGGEFTTEGVELHLLLNQIKGRIGYEYDFDADWRHKITLEKIERRRNGRLECLDGKRGNPPEEIGGPSSAARIQPGRGFDKHGFDLEAAQDRITDIF